MSTHSPVILDIAGHSLNDDDRRRLQHPLTGGLIFFTRNWQDRRQLTEVTAEVKSLRPDILITVDHEGGRVQRFRTDGFTHLPAMRKFGELWMDDAMRAVDATLSAGYVLGAELRACGVERSYTAVVGPHLRDAGARDLSEGRQAAGRFLLALAEGHLARPARLCRRDRLRRPQHGRRARRRQSGRGWHRGVECRLRHGAVVQSVQG